MNEWWWNGKPIRELTREEALQALSEALGDPNKCSDAPVIRSDYLDQQGVTR